MKPQLTGNLVGGTSLARRDHNKQLHDSVIDGRTAGLDDEDIFIANTSEDTNTGFALGKMSASLASGGVCWLMEEGGRVEGEEGEGIRNTKRMKVSYVI